MAFKCDVEGFGVRNEQSGLMFIGGAKPLASNLWTTIPVFFSLLDLYAFCSKVFK